MPRAKLPRTKKCYKIVKLAQIILERRRREQKEVVALDPLHELIRRGPVILDLVRFVDDDEIPAVAKDRLGVVLAARSIVRSDALRDVIPVFRIRRRRKAFEELALELSLPLHHQGSWRQNEHTTREPADEQFLEDDTRFDRLPEPYLVGQDRAAPHRTSEDTPCDFDLMRELLDRVGVERDEAIEAWRQRDALGLTANRCPEKGARWFLDSAGEFGECTLVDGPEIILGCYGSGHR